MLGPPRVGFPAALTQNIAAGCTILLNRRAAALVADHPAPNASSHDWWCYLRVTTVGGQVLFDQAAVALYRQHHRNHVGVPRSRARRAISAIRRGPRSFMKVLRQHVEALAARPDLLCESARSTIAQLRCALHGSFRRKLIALRLPGLQRQNKLETWLFRLWFIIG